MSLLQLLLKPNHRNLLDVVSKLPQLGVGSRVTRASWEPYGDSYWEITAVKPRNADGKFGRVWGVLTWRGEREAEPRRINGRAKKLWRWMPSQQEAARLQPLAEELRLQQAWRRDAAKQAADQGSSGGDAAGSS